MASRETPLNSMSGQADLQQELVQSSDSSREANHEAVRESLRIALEQGFIRCGRCWLLLIIFLVLGAGCVTAWSETIYEKHNRDACNQPLALMLRILYIIGLVNIFQRDIIRCILCYNVARHGPFEPMRVVLFRRGTLLATALWPIVSACMLNFTNDCSEELKSAVRTILIYYIVVVAVVLVLPCFFITVMLCLVRRGLIQFRSEDAAPETLIDELKEVTYDASLFDDAVTGGFHATCPICLDAFDADQNIVQTPCNQQKGHAFHKDCLRSWLKCARTCPLCRVDLVDANTGESPNASNA